MVNAYELIGRRAVAILSSAQFAIQPPGSEKVLKKKKCKEGNLSCGFTCISGNKICRVEMTREQQRMAAEIRKAAGDFLPADAAAGGSGGALATKGGGLATVPKPEEPKEKAPNAGINNEIDRKYAAGTDQDVDNWIEERIKANTDPTPENIAQRAADNLIDRELERYYNLDEHVVERFRKRSTDESSFIKAAIALDDYGIGQKIIKRRTYDSLLASLNSSPYLLSEKDLAATEKAAKSGNLKAAAAAVNKLRRHKEALADQKKNEKRAAQMIADDAVRYDGTPAERSAFHAARFAKESAQAKTNMEKEAKQLAGKGKKSARAIAEERLGRKTKTLDDDGNLDKEAIKVYLKNRPSSAFDSAKDRAAVKAKYRELAAKYHPDNQDTGDAVKFRQLTAESQNKLIEVS